MKNDEPTRTGKIARMPASIREEINRRLHDGQPARVILAWLHSQPEALRVLEEHFGEEPVSPQNLSEWRAGGYRDWLSRRERVDHLKVLSDYAISLARAGGSITEGAAAIAGGRILEMLETLPQEKLAHFVSALAALRSSEATALNARTKQASLAHRERELALAEARFQRQTAELFLKWYEVQAAREIVSSRDDAGKKTEKLIQLMFGDKPAS